jgi:hypothetical protein
MTRVKRVGGMAHAVECLHHKPEGLSSNPSSTKKEIEKRRY